MTSTDTVETVAKIVYEAMRWAYHSVDGEYPPAWERLGDSYAQTEARQKAAKIMAAMPSPDVGEAARIAVDEIEKQWRKASGYPDGIGNTDNIAPAWALNRLRALTTSKGDT